LIKYVYDVIAFPPSNVGSENPTSIESNFGTIVLICGGFGIVNGINGELIAGNEFPRALNAFKYTTYGFPLVRLSTINDWFEMSVEVI
jgi:hypothetical protein